MTNHSWVQKRHRRRFQLMSAVAGLNALLLVLNVAVLGFLSTLTVPQTQAESILYCMQICPMGEPCDSSTCGSVPTVTTQVASSVDSDSAIGNGTVVSDGDQTITERGFALGLAANPTIANSTYTSSGTTGSFSAVLNNLSPGTLYHVRAYATNAIGTGYGADVTFTTESGSRAKTVPTGTLTQPPGLVGLLTPGATNLNQRNHVNSIFVPGYSSISVEPGSMTHVPSPNSFITFFGSTTLKEGIVTVTLTSPNHFYGTTQADEDGEWFWVAPGLLDPGLHTFTAVVTSPQNITVQETISLNFIVDGSGEVEEDVDEEVEEEVAPEPVDQPTSPPAEEDISTPTETPEQTDDETSEDVILPAQPSLDLPPGLLPPQADALTPPPDLFHLKVRAVSAEADVITPGSSINIEFDILNMNPEFSDELTIEYKIVNSGAEIIHQNSLKVFYHHQRTTAVENYSLPPELLPDDYFIIAQLSYGGISYVSTSGMAVAQKLTRPVSTPAVLQIGNLTQSLSVLALVLGLLLLLFLLLLWQEYKKARRAAQVDDKDLWKQGLIS